MIPLQTIILGSERLQGAFCGKFGRLRFLGYIRDHLDRFRTYGLDRSIQIPESNQNTGKQPKYRKAHINTGKHPKIGV